MTDVGERGLAFVRLPFGDYAWFFPGLAISIVLALTLSGSVARRLGAPRVVAWLLVAGLGVVLAATVTPSREALMGMPQWSAGCDLSRVGPARWAEYLSIGTTTLNVVLFVPLGVAIGLLPHSRLKVVLVLGAVVLPIAIETIQLVAAPLGRACQSADVFDNLTGLALGVVGGLAAAWIGRRP